MKKIDFETTNKVAYTGSIPNTPWGYFWYVSKPFKWWMIIAITIVIIASAASQGSAYVFKLIVDAIEAGENQKVMWYALSYPILVFIIQTGYRVSAFFARRWIIGARKVGYDHLTAYVLGHSNAYFADRFAGSLLSKINNVVDAADEVSTTFLWTHLSALVAFLVTFGFMVTMNIYAGLLFALLIVALFFMNRRFGKTKSFLAKENAAAKTLLRGRIVDMLTNVQAVRQYVRFSYEGNEVGELTSDMTRKNHRNWAYTEYMLFWNGVVLFVFSLAMFGLLVMTWQQGRMSTGDFVLIISLFSQITGTLIFIGRAFESSARAVGEMEEGLDEVLLPHEVVDTEEAAQLKATAGEISWDNVNFEYGNNHVFKDFNLTIPAGQRVGLVGHSGAGKTTFVSLLLRQHDVTGGAILIDGQDIAKASQDSLRKAIAVVPQEPLLFHRSIRENIAYGKPSATKKEIEEVAKKAQAHEFITSLEHGYETLVGERGVKLSGGQKQRVAIARAMLKDAPILVLDEATSALDSESEVLIQKALHELMEGKTVIAVAHRLSTLREMDRIIVLDKGVVIEDGNHESLARAGGIYQKLWEHQAGGFLQE